MVHLASPPSLIEFLAMGRGARDLGDRGTMASKRGQMRKGETEVAAIVRKARVLRAASFPAVFGERVRYTYPRSSRPPPRRTPCSGTTGWMVGDLGCPLVPALTQHRAEGKKGTTSGELKRH